MARKRDCSEHRKTALWPDDEVQALLRALRRRQAPLRMGPLLEPARAGRSAT